MPHIQPANPQPEKNSTTSEPLKDIESGSVLQMTDSSATELLSELNSKRRRVRYGPMTLGISVFVVLMLLYLHFSVWLLASAIAVPISLTSYAYYKDVIKKTVVLFYDIEKDIEEPYQKLHDAIDELRSCTRAWHIEASGSVKDVKYHAGANTLMKRKSITISKGAVPYLQTNIEIPIIPVGRQMITFMPERVLMFDSGSVGAVPYSELMISINQSRFVEEESVPSDSTPVGRTWKYVNKKGGPDKRFKDNKELPVLLYEQIAFTSKSGLNEMIQLSRAGVGDKLLTAVSGLADKIK